MEYIDDKLYNLHNGAAKIPPNSYITRHYGHKSPGGGVEVNNCRKSMKLVFLLRFIY